MAFAISIEFLHSPIQIINAFSYYFSSFRVQLFSYQLVYGLLNVQEIFVHVEFKPLLVTTNWQRANPRSCPSDYNFTPKRDWFNVIVNVNCRLCQPKHILLLQFGEMIPYTFGSVFNQQLTILTHQGKLS
jgi:hypothetical protein